MTSLDAGALRRRLIAPHGPYADLDVVATTGSTNADLVAAAAAGAADYTVLLADAQTAGRGRHTRTWVSPPGVGLYLSVLLRPGLPPARLTTLPLLAGVALARLAERVVVDAVLKWPNDLLAGPHRAKCAGVLAEAVADPAGAPAVVVGIGLNVGPPGTTVPPGPGGLAATSFAQLGAGNTNRTELAVLLLTEFAALESAWRAAGGDAAVSGLLAAYRERCATLGSRVRAELPGGESLEGFALDVDAGGALLIRADDGSRRTVGAGDIVHLRAG